MDYKYNNHCLEKQSIREKIKEIDFVLASLLQITPQMRCTEFKKNLDRTIDES